MNIGKVLDVALAQSLLPCISDRGMVYGMVIIDRQVFEGEVGMITLGAFEYPLSVISVPRRVLDSSNLQVTQYVGLVFTDEDRISKPWESLPGYYDASEGAFASIAATTTATVHHNSAGVVGDAMLYGMDIPSGPESADVPDVVALKEVVPFTATVNSKVLFDTLNYFDFDWHALFVRKSRFTPTHLKDITNPAGGMFKATVVAPPSLINGEMILNRIRVICISDTIPPPAGEYQFRFTISCKEGDVYCVLTLTIT